jgi:uncharacterized damage-inducible protein DinB
MGRLSPVKVRELLADMFGRIPDLVDTAVHDLTPEQLHWAPAPGANSIGWLVWHLTRVQDSHIAELLGRDQVWQSGEWAGRFGLSGAAAGPRNTGYGHRAADVSAVRPADTAALTDYYAATHERTMAYLRDLDEEALDAVVDKHWDPPVTLGVRLVSVADDDVQHAGQAAYLRGLLP